jgi:hypothetical protein
MLVHNGCQGILVKHHIPNLQKNSPSTRLNSCITIIKWVSINIPLAKHILIETSYDATLEINGAIMTRVFKQFDKVCLALAQQIMILHKHQANITFLFKKMAILGNKESSKNMVLFEAKKNEIENQISLQLIAYTLLLTQTEGMLLWATQEFKKLEDTNTNPNNNDYIEKVKLGLSLNTQRIAQDKKDYLSLLEDSPFSCTQLEKSEVQSYALDCYNIFKKQKTSSDEAEHNGNDVHADLLLCTNETLDLSYS